MKIFIQTFGCQMNFHDSEKIAGILEKNNYQIVFSISQAEGIILNSCSVRKHAEEKVYSQMGRFKELKKKNPSLIIGLTGCLVKDKETNLVKRMPYLDFILSPNNIEDIAKIIKNRKNSSSSFPIIHLEDKKNSLKLGKLALRKNRFKAFVSIMQGCNNFCSYCIVPYVRGKEISRPPKDILLELEHLVSQQVKEVTLLGQNVNSYGQDLKEKIDFPELLNQCSQIPQLRRIRFITSHPKDISEKLMLVIKEKENICEHLHLPLQSGSDRILQLMNRNYTVDKYKEIIRKLRKLIPHISITTDLIVGFPGETDQDFQKTLMVLEEIEFDTAFIFKYSDRDKTNACLLNNKISEELKQNRLEKLLALQKEITYKTNKKLLGKTLEVLFEGISKKSTKELIGRTKTNKIVIVPTKESFIGKFSSVKIEEVKGLVLRGKIFDK